MSITELSGGGIVQLEKSLQDPMLELQVYVLIFSLGSNLTAPILYLMRRLTE